MFYAIILLGLNAIISALPRFYLPISSAFAVFQEVIDLEACGALHVFSKAYPLRVVHMGQLKRFYIELLYLRF